MRGPVGSLVLALAATIFALGVGEAVVRGLSLGAAPEPAAPPPLPSEYRDLPELRGVVALSRPDTRGVFKGVLHRTNSRGVRGPEYAPRPPRGIFRISVVGDSYTMGQGVEERDSYPAVAESLLNARADGRRYEVINLGVAGMAIRHSVRRLERLGLPYEPHLLVYGFTPNDIMGDDYREPSPDDQRAASELIGRFDESPSHLLRLVWPRLVLARSALWPMPGTYEYVLEENYFRNPNAAARFLEGLDGLSNLARSRGVCGLVFIHTRMNQLWLHPFERIYRWVAEAAGERGLFSHVSLPRFRGRDVASVRLSVVDTHPNALGHRLHAEALVAGLDALPAHCWAPGHFEPRGER